MTNHFADLIYDTFLPGLLRIFKPTQLLSFSVAYILRMRRHAFLYVAHLSKKVTGQPADFCSDFIPSTMSWPITVGWTESRRRCTGTRMLPGRFPRSTI